METRLNPETLSGRVSVFTVGQILENSLACENSTPADHWLLSVAKMIPIIVPLLSDSVEDYAHPTPPSSLTPYLGRVGCVETVDLELA